MEKTGACLACFPFLYDANYSNQNPDTGVNWMLLLQCMCAVGEIKGMSFF